MKKLLSLTLSLLILLSLTSCKKDEIPDELASEPTQSTGFANTDTELRCFKSLGPSHHGFVYGNNFYYLPGNCTLQVISMPTGGETETRQESTVLCSDPMCSHWLIDFPTCPAYVHDPQAVFLLDAYESAGDQPILYYARCADGDITFVDSWSSGQTYEIKRFDTGTNIAERIAAINYPIVQFVTYGENIYFLAQTAEDGYELHMVKKSGGNIASIELDSHDIHIICANADGVYVNDRDGNVYFCDPALTNSQLIYKTKDAFCLVWGTDLADLSMFIEGEYLYFYADYEAQRYPYSEDLYPTYYRFTKHSIRRVKLDSPSGEGELVVADVVDTSVYGVYNGILYYGPYDVKTGFNPTGSALQNYYSSKGTIRGVDLSSLETFDVITDCGYNFEGGPYYINDRYIIAQADPYRPDMGVTRNLAGQIPCLVSLETGAMYNLYAAVRLYDGTIGQ